MAGLFKLLIADDEGKTTVVPLVRDEVTIGRKEGNTIRLTERNVSRRHAKLTKGEAGFRIEDVKSYNGIRVNGRRIEGQHELKAGDQVVIGDYQLTLQHEAPEVDAVATAVDLKPLQPMEPVTAVRALPEPPARLVMLTPPAPGAEFALTQRTTKVGRAEDLDVWVNHRSISREHAEIVLEGSVFSIRDLGSANGVRVNGSDVKRGPIKPGDIVELGQVRFRLVGAGESFAFEADRTVAISAIPTQSSKGPWVAAAAIVGLAVVGAIAVANLGPSGQPAHPLSEPLRVEATPAAVPTAHAVPAVAAERPPAAPEGPSLSDHLSRCQLALNSGAFDDAIQAATQALALSPGDARATQCQTQAAAARDESAAFGEAQAAVREQDWARAMAAFGRLPETSAFLLRPEYAEARDAYARGLLEQAAAADSPTARGLADQVLALRGLPVAISTEASRVRGRPVAPPRRTPAPVRAPVASPVPAAPRAPTASPPPQPPPRQPEATVDAMAEARQCTLAGNHACVVRLLGGRARSAAELALLFNAQRNLQLVPAACSTLDALMSRHGGSSEAMRLRSYHVSRCQ